MSNIAIPERKNWIGASEVAVILGVSPFRTRFEAWHEKAGTITGATVEGERIDAGRHLERGIAAWAAEKWSWPLRFVAAYDQHPTVPRFGASRDFETDDAAAEPVEIKNVDGLIFRDHWSAEGDVITDAPLHYLLQVQAQMACRGAKRGWLVVCVGGNRLFRMEIPRHDKTIAKIERAVGEFWESVDQGIEPRPDFERDSAVLAQLLAETTLGKVIDLTDNNRLPDLCAEYIDAGALESAAKKRKDTAKAEITDILRLHLGEDPVSKESDDPQKARILVQGFNISQWLVKGSEVSYTREPYVGQRITAKKEG